MNGVLVAGNVGCSECDNTFSTDIILNYDKSITIISVKENKIPSGWAFSFSSNAAFCPKHSEQKVYDFIFNLLKNKTEVEYSCGRIKKIIPPPPVVQVQHKWYINNNIASVYVPGCSTILDYCEEIIFDEDMYKKILKRAQEDLNIKEIIE